MSEHLESRPCPPPVVEKDTLVENLENVVKILAGGGFWASVQDVRDAIAVVKRNPTPAADQILDGIVHDLEIWEQQCPLDKPLLMSVHVAAPAAFLAERRKEEEADRA